MKFTLKTSVITGAVLLALPLSAMAAESTLSQTATDAKNQVNQSVQEMKEDAAAMRDAAREQSDKRTMENIQSEEKKQSVSEYLDDAAVTAKVKSKFIGQKGLDSLDIKVVTVDGNVTLMGDVDNAAQVGLAENAAKEVEGVNTVSNKLVVKK